MSTQTRRSWTSEAKLQILNEARQAGDAVSEVCRRHQIAVGQFYLWERLARAGALEGLQARARGPKVEPEVERLRRDLERTRSALIELAIENLELKRGLSG